MVMVMEDSNGVSGRHRMTKSDSGRRLNGSDQSGGPPESHKKYTSNSPFLPGWFLEWAYIYLHNNLCSCYSASYRLFFAFLFFNQYFFYVFHICISNACPFFCGMMRLGPDRSLYPGWAYRKANE